MTRPLPDPSFAEFAEFWRGTRENRLLVQQCADCGTHRWPPRAACHACRGLDTRWVDASPTGTLYTWTVVEHQTVPGIAAPYVVGLVALDEPDGVRFLGQVVGIDPADLTVGLPLTARFEAADEEIVLVNWAPRENRT